MLNVTAIGNLTKDPEKRTTGNGKTVASFDLACRVGFGENKKTEFVRCSFFGATADLVLQYCHKGDSLYVSGRGGSNGWVSKADNEAHSQVSIIGENVEFCKTARREGDSKSGTSSGYEKKQAPASAPENFVPDNGDDLPF